MTARDPGTELEIVQFEFLNDAVYGQTPLIGHYDSESDNPRPHYLQ